MLGVMGRLSYLAFGFSIFCFLLGFYIWLLSAFIFFLSFISYLFYFSLSSFLSYLFSCVCDLSFIFSFFPFYHMTFFLLCFVCLICERALKKSLKVGVCSACEGGVRSSWITLTFCRWEQVKKMCLFSSLLPSLSFSIRDAPKGGPDDGLGGRPRLSCVAASVRARRDCRNRVRGHK